MSILSILFMIDAHSQCTPAFEKDTNAMLTLSVEIGKYTSPVFVDIDNDGDNDLFIGDENGYIYFYENTGNSANAVFVNQIGNNNPFNGVDVGSFSSPTFADIDNDGDQDALIGELDSNIYFFENIGSSVNPIFNEKTGISNPFDTITLGENVKPTFTDIDNDGDLDLFIGEYYKDTIRYYKNIGDATSPIFSEQNSSNNPLGNFDVSFMPGLTFIDIDNDGDKDAYVAVSENSYPSFNNCLYIFINNGTASNPNFSFKGKYLDPNLDRYSTPAFVDIDNDGDYDCFLGGATGYIYFYENQGSAFSAKLKYVSGNVNIFNSDISFALPFLVDIDNDGDYDAFVSSQDVDNDYIYFYENIGDKTKPNFIENDSKNPLSDLYYPFWYLSNAHLVFVDIDNDGDKDMFGTGVFFGFSNGIPFLENIGNSDSAKFIETYFYPFNILKKYVDLYPFFVDIDNDDDLDVFIGTNDSYINYYKNIGTSTSPDFILVTGTDNPFGGFNLANITYPSFADLDNDGDFDAIVGNDNDEAATWIDYYENIGDSSSPIFILHGTDNPFKEYEFQSAYLDYVFESGTFLFADIDNDNDLDAFIGQENGIACFYNVGCSTSKISKVNSNIHKINIFPNPSSSIVNIENLPDFANIQLIDVLGKELKLDVIQISNSSCQFSANNLPRGIYYLQVIGKEGYLNSTQFIKN